MLCSNQISFLGQAENSQTKNRVSFLSLFFRFILIQSCLHGAEFRPRLNVLYKTHDADISFELV